MLVGNYTASLVLCDGSEEDISDHVLIQTVVQGGIQQLLFRLAYLPTDHGSEPVYLKIDRYGNGAKFYYSNLFHVTDDDIELTSRIDYVDRLRLVTGLSSWNNGFGQPILSVRLALYPKDYSSESEVDRYRQLSRSQNVTPGSLRNELQVWETQLFDAWTFKRLQRALHGPCYINQVRQYPYKALEFKPREGEANFSQNTFTTDPDDLDTLNIIEVIIGASYEDFLASSSELASSSYLVSQLQIPA